MSFLGPVFHSELLRLGRRRRYFFLRFAFLVVILLIFTLSFYSFYKESQARAAGGVMVGGVFYSSGLARGNVNQAMTQAATTFSCDLFLYVQLVELALLLLVAPIVVAGTIVEEKEKHSLDLLFATSLSDREIIWGKLGSRLILLGCLVVSAYPLLALTLILGGVEPEQIFAFLLANLATLFAVAGVSIWFSVQLRTLRGAIVGILPLLLALNVAWIVPALLSEFRPWLASHYPEWVELVEAWRQAAIPFSAFGFIVEVGQGQQRGQGVNWSMVTLFCGVQLMLGFVAQAFAAAQLRPAHLRQQVEQARADRHLRRRPRMALWQSFPLYWKEMTARPASRFTWLVWLVVVAASLLWLLPPVLDVLPIVLQDNHTEVNRWRWSAPGRSLPPPLQAYQFLVTSLPAGITLAAMLALLVTLLRAAGSFAQERDRLTWDDLLSAPVGIRELLNAKSLGSVWASRWLMTYFMVLVLAAFLVFPWMLPLAVGIYQWAALLLLCQLGLLFSQIAKTALRAWVSAALALAAMIVVPIVLGRLLPRGQRVGDLADLLLALLDAAEYIWVLGLAVAGMMVVAKYSPKRLQALLLAVVYWLAIGLPVFVFCLVALFISAESLNISMPASVLALLLSPPGALLFSFYEGADTPWEANRTGAALIVVGIMFSVAAFILWWVNYWLLARTSGRVDGTRQAKRFPRLKDSSSTSKSLAMQT